MIDYQVSIKYMIAGYSVILGILILYSISLISRWRSKNKEYKSLKELEKRLNNVKHPL